MSRHSFSPSSRRSSPSAADQFPNKTTSSSHYSNNNASFSASMEQQQQQQHPQGSSGANPLSNALSWLRLPRPGSSRNLDSKNNSSSNNTQLDLDGARSSSLQFLLQEQRAKEMAEALSWIRNHPDYEEANGEEEEVEVDSSTGTTLEDKLNNLSRNSDQDAASGTFLRSRLEAMIPGAVGSDPAELVEKLERAVLDWLRSHQHSSNSNLRSNSWDDISLASSTVISLDDSQQQQQQGDGTSRAKAVLARDMLHALSWLLKAKADTARLSVEEELHSSSLSASKPDPSSSSSKLADGSSLTTAPFSTELSSSIYPTKDVAVALEQLLLKPKANDQQHQDGGMDQEDEERMSRLYHSQTSGRYTQPSSSAAAAAAGGIVVASSSSSSSSVSTAGRTASSSMRPRDLSSALAMIRELGNRVSAGGTSYHPGHGRQHYDQSTASMSSSHDDAPSTLKEVPAVTHRAANHRMLEEEEDDDDDDEIEEEEEEDFDVDHDRSASLEHEDYHVGLHQPDSPPPPPSPLSLAEQQDRDMAQAIGALRLGGGICKLLSQEEEDDDDHEDENDEVEDCFELEEEEEEGTEFDVDEPDETSQIQYSAQPVALHHRQRIEVDDDHDDDENDSQDEDEEMDNLVKSLTHDVVGQLDSLRIMGDDDQSETERGGGGIRRGRRRADGSTDHVVKSSLAEEERRAREMADAIESLRMLETFANLDETDDDDELDQSLLYQRRRSSRKLPSDIDSLRMGDDEQDDGGDDDESVGFLSSEERRAQEIAEAIDSLRMRQADSPVDSNEGGSIKSFTAELQRGREMAHALDDLLDTQHESPPESPTGSVRSEERRPRERRSRPRRTAGAPGAVTRRSLFIDDSSATSFRSHTGTPSQTNRMDDGSDPSEIRAVSIPIEEENGDRVRSMADALHWLRGSGEELDEASLSSSLSDFSDDEENTGGSSFEVSFELMSTEIDNAFQWLRQTTPNLDDVDDESLHAFRHLAGLPMVEGEMDPEDKSAARGAAIAWLQQNYFTKGDMDNVTLDSFAGLADSIACFTDDQPSGQPLPDGDDMFLSYDDQVIALQYALDWLRSNDPNCDDMDDEALCKLATLAGVEVPRDGAVGLRLSSRIEKQMVLDDVLECLRKSEHSNAIDPERIDAKTVEALLRMTGWSANGGS